MVSKSSLSERDICTKYITPALLKAGWSLETQIREELTLTNGRIIVRGKLHTRAKNKRADYVLFYVPNIPLAVIEAKDNNHSIADGMQQALGYADMLQVPFVFSSNGDGFQFHNKLAINKPVVYELGLDEFPSPGQLWAMLAAHKGFDPTQESIVTQDYYSDASNKAPRYYQLLAINKTIEVIARGQNRILLVMATGTGKTYTAFQIIWRLWKSKNKKRILYLADRNILIDQTMTNDFKPFSSAMTKIQKRQVNKSYEIYLSLYQAVTGTEEEMNIYKQFSRDFFDLIIVDECHRGSAADDSNWRQILEYFSSATQIGMTATPKETKDVSNIHYFGDPIYTYSLKQGIEDGFLAPYKVVRIDLDKDITGWRPDKGKTDKYGNEIEDRVYNQKDFDRSLILEKRTELVAKKVSEFLRQTNRFDKTIVFCSNIAHAERMRIALVNENSDLAADSKYVMRITGDNEEGKMELDNFIFPESKYPVIATTSKLMTTGVDAQTCKLIVLDQIIHSMTEFKQIIGRGTRINEDYGKYYFTIIDFKKATELFADPDFDGDPVQIYEPKSIDDSPVPPDDDEQGSGTDNTDDFALDVDPNLEQFPYFPITEDSTTGQIVKKYYVADVPVAVLAERVQYFDPNGKLITESLRDYTRKAIFKEYSSLDEFLTRWQDADKKKAIIEELANHGVFFDALEEEIGRNLDPFDLICHVAWDRPPLTRKERAENVKKRDYFAKYGEQARNVLNALLDKYADEGITHIEERQILTISPFSEMGTPVEIVQMFGDIESFTQAVAELEHQLYSA
ncbi:MAG: DEAD/DEAH box helicase family protein [Candidatus Cloacimonetes bacterium]|nr:DEAD/DEAH box helicase family protein [Candidatus Cloacimonadota bacterium]